MLINNHHAYYLVAAYDASCIAVKFYSVNHAISTMYCCLHEVLKYVVIFLAVS